MNQTLFSPPQSSSSDKTIYKILTNFRKSIKQINPEANPYMIFENIKKWLNLQSLNLKDSEQAQYLDNIQTDIINKPDQIRDFEQQNNSDNSEINNLDDLVINNLVSKLWKSPLTAPKLEQEKQEVVNKIKDAIENKGFTQKTENLYALCYVILDLAKPSLELLAHLLKLVKETETNKILLSNREGKQDLANLVRKKMIDNWREGALSNHYTEIETQLINDDSSFWLLVTYRYILLHSQEENNEQKLLIPFYCDNEKQRLLNLRLVIKDHNNLFKIANQIYQKVFNRTWVEENLANFQDTKANLWTFMNSNMNSNKFEEIIKPLHEKQGFPEHIKSILENTIYWTQGKQDLTKKILSFIEQAIVKYEPNNFEWFNKNIIFSRLLGDKKYEITEEDFTKLINRLVLSTEGLSDENFINKNLTRLTTKFKNNPVLIANKVLSLTKNSDEVEKLVDDIVAVDSIIKDEDDVNKITITLLEQIKHNEELNMVGANGNNENSPNPEKLDLDGLLDYIVTASKDIEAILLVFLQDGEAQYYNSQLKDTSPELYKKLQGKEGRLEGLENFEQIRNIPTVFNEFGKEIGGSILDYALFYMINPKRMLIASFTDIDGEDFAIIYIGREAVAMSRLINKVEKTIPLIKNALQKDRDFI